MWLLQVNVLVLVATAAVAGHSIARSRDQIESFKNFLESTRTDDGVRLETRMIGKPWANAWESSGKYEGDILLDDAQVQALVEQYAAGRNAFIWPNTKWPNDTIVYEFGEGEFDPEQQVSVLEGIRDIESHTCLKFRLKKPEDSNYVRLTGNPNGCYANVGYWPTRGPHTLNLARAQPGRGCLTHSVVVHEFIHIIGFYHMQSTYNRDDYVRIVWDNIEPGKEHNFALHAEDRVSNLGVGYEYDSNMHYGANFFSVNGKPTIIPLHEFDGVMGQQVYITANDWLRINRHYNCPGAWDEPSTIEGRKTNV